MMRMKLRTELSDNLKLPRSGPDLRWRQSDKAARDGLGKGSLSELNLRARNPSS